jgi:hypothetical protein
MNATLNKLRYSPIGNTEKPPLALVVVAIGPSVIAANSVLDNPVTGAVVGSLFYLIWTAPVSWRDLSLVLNYRRPSNKGGYMVNSKQIRSQAYDLRAGAKPKTAKDPEIYTSIGMRQKESTGIRSDWFRGAMGNLLNLKEIVAKQRKAISIHRKLLKLIRDERALRAEAKKLDEMSRTLEVLAPRINLEDSSAKLSARKMFTHIRS